MLFELGEVCSLAASFMLVVLLLAINANCLITLK